MPISLDEIRYGRLMLTKVSVDCSSPSRIKNDIHDITPEFLDIRPTLKNVADRVTPARPTPFKTEIVFQDDTTETGSTQQEQEASLDSLHSKYLRNKIRDFNAFETIMEDIRSRRYKLNKIMVDGCLPPRVKEDAQLTNLEFMAIRSTLKKATNRVLRPSPKKILNPVEALMESIRQTHNLKHVRTKESSKIQGRRIISSDITSSPLSSKQCANSNLNNNPGWTNINTSQETHLTSLDQSKIEEPRKRLIKPDPNLLDFIF